MKEKIKMLVFTVDGQVREEEIDKPEGWDDPPPIPLDPLEQLQAEYDALILDQAFRLTLLELGVN
jgi:hypothetical protein